MDEYPHLGVRVFEELTCLIESLRDRVLEIVFLDVCRNRARVQGQMFCCDDLFFQLTQE